MKRVTKRYAAIVTERSSRRLLFSYLHRIMIKDFAASDRITLRCSKIQGCTEVDARTLHLGPSIELLTFRRRSLPPGAELKLLGNGTPLSIALKAMPSDTAWAYRTSGSIGALRVQAGRPSNADDIVQQQFLMDIRKRLELEGVPKSSAQALTGAAGELIDNIGQHAGPQGEALAAFDITQGSFWLAVGDSGVGALATYSAMREVQSARQALEVAVVEHRSSTGDPARGLGFRRVLGALRSMDAALRVRSGDASLEIEGTGGSGNWMSREQQHLRGFVVSAHVQWGALRP